MKLKFSAITLLLVTGMLASTASFAGLTRDQVRADLAAAVASGNMPASGEHGLNLNEMYPGNYPAKSVSTGATREQVKAELASAMASGDMLAPGDSGLKLNELHPARYAATQPIAFMQGRTSAQAQALQDRASKSRPHR